MSVHRLNRRVRRASGHGGGYSVDGATWAIITNDEHIETAPGDQEGRESDASGSALFVS